MRTPRAPPAAFTALQIPKARTRARPEGKASASSASAAGASAAAPTPCAARAAHQMAGRLREAAEQGREAEQAEPRQQDPLAAVPVGGLPAEQQQPAEGERVGVDHPGQPGRAEAEPGGDLREPDVHHRQVQRHHELHDGDGGEDEPRPRLGRGGRCRPRRFPDRHRRPPGAARDCLR
nr:hypothetical protein [Actinomadura geliboluensis]